MSEIKIASTIGDDRIHITVKEYGKVRYHVEGYGCKIEATWLFLLLSLSRLSMKDLEKMCKIAKEHKQRAIDHAYMDWDIAKEIES